MRSRVLLVLLLASLVAVMPAWSQWFTEDGEAPDTEWRKSSGKLGAMLVVTDEPEAFFEAWNKPPSPDYKPEIEPATMAHRGDKVVGVVLFVGCAPDEEGTCQMDMDLRLFYPDGSLYGEFRNAEVWRDKAPPPPGNVQVSVANIRLGVEPNDPFGTYRFVAVVRDRVAGQTFELVQRIEVVPDDAK